MDLAEENFQECYSVHRMMAKAVAQAAYQFSRRARVIGDDTVPELSSKIKMTTVGKLAAVEPAEVFFDDASMQAHMFVNNWSVVELFDIVGRPVKRESLYFASFIATPFVQATLPPGQTVSQV